MGIELLTPNHAGVLKLKDDTTMNYGVIRIENGNLVFFTGKGLREIWAPNLVGQAKEEAEKLKRVLEEENGEQKLQSSEHIAIIPLDQIGHVMH
jgi:hypothetical protein